MCRRIAAVCLAVCILLLSFGCGKETGGATKPDGKAANTDKIAIVVGDRSQAPEVYAAASELASAHPESVIMLKYSEAFFNDANAVTQIATAAAENNTVKAILFADGVLGTGAAVKAVRQAREDICIVVCDPHENSAETRDADLTISVDFPALGKAMVDKAKEMGAEHFLFYTNVRHLQYGSVISLRTAVESACKNAGISVNATSCVDIYEEGRSLELAKQYVSEDAARSEQKVGKKIAAVCTEPQVQGALAAQTRTHDMVMPAPFLPSPLALAADLGVDLTDHETDSAYALEKLRAKDVGVSGRVATWGFSAYAAFLQTAFDYASLVVNGEDKTTSIESVQKLLEAHTAGAQVTVTTDANGAYLVQSDLVTL